MPIRTRSRSEKGFRRAGVRHTPEPQVFPDDQFTAKQLKALKEDPELFVEVLEEKKKDPPKDSK